MYYSIIERKLKKSLMDIYNVYKEEHKAFVHYIRSRKIKT